MSAQTVRFTARMTKVNDCCACHQHRGIWRDPTHPRRWLCDECFAIELERSETKADVSR